MDEKNHQSTFKNKLSFAFFISIIIFISGCSFTPVPISDDEFKNQAILDYIAVTQNQDAISKPISLYEAMARALKYNLDYHLESSKKALAEADVDVSNYALLPQLVAKAEYNSRDKFSGGSSRSLLTGIESLQASTSSNRDVITTDLTLSWNILDFGLSYIRAKQSADKVLIAEQDKRKTINRIIQDVRTVYWRAVSYDRLIKKMESLFFKVSRAIVNSEKVRTNRLENPLTSLTYQRELVEIKRKLEKLQRDLSLSKIQLAALMNLRPGESYELLIPDKSVHILNNIDIPIDVLEQLALESRPELRTIYYKQRINSKETKAAILSLMPNLNLHLGKNYSSNDYLYHNNWLGFGSQVSWNLLKLFSLPSINRQTDAKDKLLGARRLAMSMAVMTQIHVSLASYEYSKREFNTTETFYSIQRDILEEMNKGMAAKKVTEQSFIREEMNMMVAEVEYDMAYADIENSYANVFSALGVDSFYKEVDLDNSTLEELTNSIRNYFAGLSLGDQLFAFKE